jgi:hypothetical protein
VQVDLRSSWWIREVEIPTRLVLAPMAGVSVQAFRRQGRRYGAGLVLLGDGQLRRAAPRQRAHARLPAHLADERPLAVQIFGSEPEVDGEAARWSRTRAPTSVDINFGCPVKKVTKTGPGATLLEDPARACAVVEAVASAVSVPGDGEDARGLEARLAGVPLARAGAGGRGRVVADAAPALGTADVHRRGGSLADGELAARVDVPVIARVT